MFTNTQKSSLESPIVKQLVEQNGYEHGQSDDYNMEYAMNTVHLFRFLKDAQPEAVEKLKLKTNPHKQTQFLACVRNENTRHCIVAVQGNQSLSGKFHHVLHDAKRQ